MIIDWVHSEIVGFLSSFESEPVGVGITMLIVFFIIGILVSYRNPYNLGLRFIVQWTCANIIARYLCSYISYDKPLREGFWPLLWNFAGIFGIYLVWRKRGFH
jgi:hypothetical protein